MANVEENINNIIGLYINYGKEDYIGEELTQLEHMTKAAMLAEQQTNGINLTLGAFLHDIGHLLEHLQINDKMGHYGVLNHELLGERFLLDNNIQYPVTEYVKKHVDTKRYLVYKKPEYYNKLSEASKKTLEYQGGPMNKNEALIFEDDPLFENHMKMRYFDDNSKNVKLKLKDLEYYKHMLISYFNINFK